MRARSTLKTATCSRSAASPATTGGKTGRGSPMASNGRSTGRTCRSPAIIGQSYRLTARPGIFPDGTGLTDRLSDIVGRTRVRYRPIDRPHPPLPARQGQFRGPPQRGRPDVRHRADLCPDRLSAAQPRTSARRSRICATRKSCGSPAGSSSRATGRCSARPCSTSPTSEEDPLSLADGFEPVRHRLGIAYEDECLELGVSWRRDYERLGDFTKGSTFSFSFALKGLGR